MEKQGKRRSTWLFLADSVVLCAIGLLGARGFRCPASPRKKPRTKNPQKGAPLVEETPGLVRAKGEVGPGEFALSDADCRRAS